MSGLLANYFSVYSIPEHSGLDLIHQPVANQVSPWLKALHLDQMPAK
jgi:hypothetical protein